MSAWAELQLATDAVTPHVVAVALIGARLGPLAFLCPLFGGPQAPTTVKLGLVLALAFFVHWAGGVTVDPGQARSALDFAALATREGLFGTTLGLLASLPFDAARMGGRFIDLFRGSSAEASLPLAGTKEAASGDALYHLLLALCASGATLPLWLKALMRSFAAVKLGAFVASEPSTLYAVALVGTSLATALAVATPIAGLSLAVDAVVGFASRAASNAGLQELASPVRILGGGALLWTLLGLFSERFLTFGAGMADAVTRLTERGHG